MTLRSTVPVAGVLLATDSLVLLVTQALLAPPPEDLALLGLFLLGSGTFALAVGYLLPSIAQRGAFGSLQAQVVLIPVVVVILTVANVAFIGRLMFVSAHDLGLLTVLLIFSLAMAVVVASVLSGSLRQGIQALTEAVRDMTSGNLRARAQLGSRDDELAQLARAFNHMAEQVEESFARQQEVERARRNMVVAISHDLRTPLSSIRAMAESINDRVVTDPETVRQYLSTMETEVARLSLLIEDLFELSQIDAGALQLHLEAGSLRDLVSDTLESMRVQARQRDLALDGQVDEALPDVLMDARQLQRVLVNLIQNAIRHTPSGGTVCIQAWPEGETVRVEVSDSGEGIAPQDLPRVFEPFFQGDPARSKPGGSGLGLSIVKALIEAHGGQVWVTSTPGEGSTFAFTVPLVH